MGILTKISDTQALWKPTKQGEPTGGTYTFRGLDAQRNWIWQSDEKPSVICIQIFNELVPVGDINLSDLQHSTGQGSGGANYGLTQSPDTVFTFNTTSQELTVVKYEGKNDSKMDVTDIGAAVSEATTFNMPTFVSDKDGNQYYPLNYWFTPGNVNYFSLKPPSDPVFDKLRGDGKIYVKEQSLVKLTAGDLRTCDKQTRDPDQSVVMGRALGLNYAISARDHLLTVFSISSEPRSWHWCHLIAHSMRPNAKGQVADNLVAGTAGVNGAMLALENAIKEFIIGNEGVLSHLDYQVEAHVLWNSHIAKHIKATIGQFGVWSWVHYMEATVAERELTSQTAEFVREIREAAGQAGVKLK